MILPTIDGERISVDVCMVKEFHARGRVLTEVTMFTKDRFGRNDMFKVKETPADIINLIRKEKTNG